MNHVAGSLWGTFIHGCGVHCRIPRKLPEADYTITFTDNISTPCGKEGSMIFVFRRDIDHARIMVYAEGQD